jgi:Lamin Tail Domain
MLKKLLVTAATAGATAALAVAAPSYAATAPTLTGPASRAGFGPVTLGGIATPGATVQLYETAIVFDDLEPADDWQNGGGPLTATADASGHWQIQRLLDSGFYFQVVADGVRSNKLTVHIQEDPTLTVRATGANTITARVSANPAEPTLPVQVQMAAGTGWTTIAGGRVGDDGTFDSTVGNVPAGAHAFRAYVAADSSNGVLAGYSPTADLTVGGTAAGPVASGVEFTRIQYKATSLNGESVRVTNTSKASVDLKGWTVRDAGNHVYTFTSSVRLGPGAGVSLHTGKGANTTVNRYWGRTGYVWDDRGDTATLRNSAGRTVDTCKWGAGSGVTGC